MKTFDSKHSSKPQRSTSQSNTQMNT